MHQIQTAPDRQSGNPLFDPYLDVLKEYIPEILRIIYETYGNWCTLKSGWKELTRASKATTTVTKITMQTAVKDAVVSFLVEGGTLAAKKLAKLTLEDWQDQNLSRKEFKKRLMHNITSAVGNIVLGTAGVATGATIGTLIHPRLGTVIGTIIGDMIGGAVGAKLSHYVRKRMA